MDGESRLLRWIATQPAVCLVREFMRARAMPSHFGRWRRHVGLELADGDIQAMILDSLPGADGRRSPV